MIKEVTIYETSDGSQFNTQKQAEQYETLYEKCQTIMRQLRPHEKDGAVQQDVEKVKKAFAEFMDLCGETIPEFKKTFIGVKDGCVHQSWAHRIISDYNIECLCHAFFRFTCINMTSGVEYEQPYYVEHESEWEKVIH